MESVNYDIVNQAVTNKYQNAEKTKRDVMNTLHTYRGLTPKVDSFVFNDGSERKMLNLDGTVPVPFKGSVYNIPLCIWLLDNHPMSSPMVYVKPTSDMLIKASRHVDQNGKVYLPYLHEWNPNSSDLSGLIQIMIMTFCEMPPVYSKGKQSTPYPIHPTGGYMPMPQATGYPQGPQNNVPSYMPPYPSQPPGYPATNTPYPIYPTNTQGYPQVPQVPPTQSNSFPAPYSPGMPYSPYPPTTAFNNQPSSGAATTTTTSVASSTGTITEEHIRASLISAVSDRVRARLRDVYGGVQAEVSVLRQQQADLNQGKSKLEGLVSKLEQEQSELDKSVRILRERETEIKAVLSRLSSVTEPLDVDEAVTTTAPVYKQLLNCYAEDQATQDAIYYLGEALRRDVIDLDLFLKHVRSLSRKQFQLRATMIKCRAKANMAG